MKYTVKLPERIAIIALVLTVGADVLVYGTVPGASYAILIAALVVGMLLSRSGRRFSLATTVLCALLGLVAIQFVIQPSVSGFMLGLLLLCGLSFQAAEPYRRNLVGFLWRSVVSGISSIFCNIADLLGWGKSTLKGRKFPVPAWWVIAVPVFLVLLFGLMLAGANPVFGKWIESAWDAVHDNIVAFFRQVNMLRFLFWLLFFTGVYGVIRMRYRLADGAKPKQPRLYVHRVDPRAQYVSCLVSMVCLNVLFVIVNTVDVLYLWLSTSLPEGVTYARYAHTGSNRLIVTAILSAVVVCVFYRRDTIQAQSLPARLLVHLWVLQNMFLILSAFRRLQIYVDVYGLTRWRIAAVLWMALVLCGFVLTILKIGHNWNTARLVKANIIVSLVLFYLVGFLNIDGLIADYNVEQYLAGRAKENNVVVDVSYLAGLDYNALPAIARLKAAPDPKVAARARLHLHRETARLRAQALDWRSYQWRRSRALRAIESASR